MVQSVDESLAGAALGVSTSASDSALAWSNGSGSACASVSSASITAVRCVRKSREAVFASGRLSHLTLSLRRSADVSVWQAVTLLGRGDRFVSMLDERLIGVAACSD